MVRDKQSESRNNRQADAEAMKKKVGAKSTSATKDKTKYPADWTKWETGEDGVRTATNHERSAAEAYERCGMSRKTAIALVEEGYAQMSDLQGSKSRKDVTSLMNVMRSPGDATYGYSVTASFERCFYIMTWAAMYLERCSRDLDMDEINPDWCLQWEHQILLEEKNVNISPYDYPVASISQTDRLFELLFMVLANIRDLYGIPLIGYVRYETFILPSDDHRGYYNRPDAEMKAQVMIYDQEDPKTDKVAMGDDQIVIARADTLNLVATAAMPLVWEVLFHFFGNTQLWVHVRCTTADKNGRLAYFLLRHHMMVPGYLTSQSPPY